MNTFRRSITLLIFHAVSVAAMVTVLPAYSRADGEESVEVNCYQKGPDESIPVGNVTVTRPETAAVNCNATYYDCHDKCIGCFYDPKTSQTVCYNAAQEMVPQ